MIDNVYPKIAFRKPPPASRIFTGRPVPSRLFRTLQQIREQDPPPREESPEKCPQEGTPKPKKTNLRPPGSARTPASTPGRLMKELAEALRKGAHEVARMELSIKKRSVARSAHIPTDGEASFGAPSSFFYSGPKMMKRPAPKSRSPRVSTQPSVEWGVYKDSFRQKFRTLSRPDRRPNSQHLSTETRCFHANSSSRYSRAAAYLDRDVVDFLRDDRLTRLVEKKGARLRAMFASLQRRVSQSQDPPPVPCFSIRTRPSLLKGGKSG